MDDRRFAAREARAVLWLLPVLGVAAWLVWEVARADGWAEARGEVNLGYPSAKADGNIRFDTIFTTPGGVPPSIPPLQGGESTARDPELFVFDPNTVEYHDLVRLGFESNEALGIVKYRERGKVFEIAEDFAACYQVSEEMYRRLEPFIRIGEEFRLRRWDEAPGDEGPSVPSVKTDGNVSSIERRPSPQAGEASCEGGNIKFDTILPSASANESGASSTPRALARSFRPALVDLNAADSAALIAVSGIGAGTVGRIMEYRARLGGFAAVEQLAEVRGITEQNYLRIVEQIYVDPKDIRKIDINFAPAKVLAEHPYLRAQTLRKLLKERQLKGGWRSITELETDHIFNEEELVRLGPYLVFN